MGPRPARTTSTDHLHFVDTQWKARRTLSKTLGSDSLKDFTTFIFKRTSLLLEKPSLAESTRVPNPSGELTRSYGVISRNDNASSTNEELLRLLLRRLGNRLRRTLEEGRRRVHHHSNSSNRTRYSTSLLPSSEQLFSLE